MTKLQAVLEDALSKLSPAEWDALEARVRGPRRDYPAPKRDRKMLPDNGGNDQ